MLFHTAPLSHCRYANGGTIFGKGVGEIKDLKKKNQIPAAYITHTQPCFVHNLSWEPVCILDNLQEIWQKWIDVHSHPSTCILLSWPPPVSFFFFLQCQDEALHRGVCIVAWRRCVFLFSSLTLTIHFSTFFFCHEATSPDRIHFCRILM